MRRFPRPARGRQIQLALVVMIGLTAFEVSAFAQEQAEVPVTAQTTSDTKVEVDQKYVNTHLGKLVEDENLSRYIL